ncbi:hypothetical protein RB195_008444 [Necator americanus]
MKTSYSTPQLQTPTVAEKFLFPKGDEQKMRKYSVEQKSDSGIVKDTLTQKDSWLSVDGYFTPRETIKRKKEIPQPCHDSVSTERLYMDRPRRSGGGGGGAANAGIRSRITSSKAILTEKDWKEYDLDYLDVAKLQLKRMSEDMKRTPPLSSNARLVGASLTSLTDASRVQFSLSQTPPMAPPVQPSFSPILQSFSREHRGELDMSEKYNYDLSKAQLKASSRTSALLAGFAMVALVELQYDQSTPHWLLILLGVVTTLLVSVHLLALMMSTCILPYMEATGCTQDSPHIRLKFYIDLSWLFSTCIGLLLFLVEIGIIFFVKFTSVDYPVAGYITTILLIPVVVVFVVFSYLIHKSRVSHTLGRFKDKVDTMKQFLDVEAQMTKSSLGAVKDI